MYYFFVFLLVILCSIRIFYLLLIRLIIFNFGCDGLLIVRIVCFLRFGVMLLVIVPKLLITFIMLLEDTLRLMLGTKNYFTNYGNDTFFPERRKFISQVALGIAAVPFLSLIYGMTIGKYNFKVFRQTLFFPDLPEAFEGFKVTHISDIHSGSFDDEENTKVRRQVCERCA